MQECLGALEFGLMRMALRRVSSRYATPIPPRSLTLRGATPRANMVRAGLVALEEARNLTDNVVDHGSLIVAYSIIHSIDDYTLDARNGAHAQFEGQGVRNNRWWIWHRPRYC